MDVEKPRLARLTAILTQLQSRRLVNATELAEKHEVSIRTIYRDIRTLERSGVPIVTEEGRGYSLLEGYRLPPVTFSEEEANALITAGELLLKDRDGSLVEHYTNAVTKIKAVMRNGQRDKTELLSRRLQVRTPRTHTSTSRYLIELQSAVTNFQVVHIEYHSLQGQQTERDVEPFALFTTQENWVLIAYCRLRKEFRYFRLDCIQSLRLVSEHFEQHDLTIQEYFDRCYPRG